MAKVGGKKSRRVKAAKETNGCGDDQVPVVKVVDMNGPSDIQDLSPDLDGSNVVVEGKVEGKSGKKRRRRLSVDEEGVTADALVVAIQGHDEYFSRLLDMIPENLILRPKEINESSYSSKYMKNKACAATHQSRKEESKKSKRARYAADNQKTLLEKQQVSSSRSNIRCCLDNTSIVIFLSSFFLLP
ncbi:unnamed protein product [Choristocarpus tenellus]